MSRGSSTTQITVLSRRSSAQIDTALSPVPSAMLKQRLQNVTLSFASVIERASRAASSRDSFSRWKAMRCADFGPMPGQPAQLVDEVLDRCWRRPPSASAGVVVRTVCGRQTERLPRGPQRPRSGRRGPVRRAHPSRPTALPPSWRPDRAARPTRGLRASRRRQGRRHRARSSHRSNWRSPVARTTTAPPPARPS